MIKIRYTLTVPEYTATGSLLNTNILPGGTVAGEAANEADALAAVDAVLATRKAQYQAQVAIFDQVEALLA
jgi:hypothetical protein